LWFYQFDYDNQLNLQFAKIHAQELLLEDERDALGVLFFEGILVGHDSVVAAQEHTLPTANLQLLMAFKASTNRYRWIDTNMRHE
jgi:hypothetical protein